MSTQKSLSSFFSSPNAKKRVRATLIDLDAEEEVIDCTPNTPSKKPSRNISSPAPKKRKTKHSSEKLQEVEEQMKNLRRDIEQKEREVKETYDTLLNLRCIAQELKEHPETVEELQTFQTQQSSTQQKEPATVFPDDYIKLLSAYVQDSSEVDLDKLVDSIINEWITVPKQESDAPVTPRRRFRKKEQNSDKTASVEPQQPITTEKKKKKKKSKIIGPITSLNFTKESLKTKINSFSTLENYGVPDVPELGYYRRELLHLKHLPKDPRNKLQERRKEAKTLRKKLRDQHKAMVKLNKELEKLESRAEKIEENEQVQQKQQTPKPKLNSITKFTTKMRSIDLDGDVVMTDNRINALAEDEIDEMLSAAQVRPMDITVKTVLEEMKNARRVSSQSTGKRVRFYMYSKLHDPEDKIMYVKKFLTKKPELAGDISIPDVKLTPKQIGRSYFKKFQLDVDYEEPCYEEAEDDEVCDDEIVDGEDIMSDDGDDDLPQLPGMEDYDEDDDHDFVVHDGYVSGEGEDSLSDDESGEKVKREFNREENIQLKKQNRRKRGKGMIELVVLDTQHFYYTSDKMAQLECLTAQTVMTLDFTDLVWFGDEKKVTPHEPPTPKKEKKEKNSTFVAEHKIPLGYADAIGRSQWKQYMILPDLTNLIAFAEGYEGSKIKLSEEFVAKYPISEDKRTKLSKALIQRQMDEISYKERLDKSKATGAKDASDCLSPPRSTSKLNAQCFRIYQFVLDVRDGVVGFPAEMSGDLPTSDKSDTEEVTEGNTPARRRRYFRRCTRPDDSSSEEEEEERIPQQQFSTTIVYSPRPKDKTIMNKATTTPSISSYFTAMSK